MKRIEPTNQTSTMSFMAKKLELTRVRTLDLPPGTSPPFIAAASGLVRVGKSFWVVADDENVMASFPVASGPGKVLTVFPGKLPDDPKQRKAAKPDLEALFLLPRSVSHATSDLLIGMGSGSKPNRYRGVSVPVDAEGDASGHVRIVDWTPLFSSLAAQFPKLNIEGAAIVGDRLRLAQRGNGKRNVSALIDLDVNDVARAIVAGQPIPQTALRRVQRIDLGEVHGVPWTITDLAALPDGRLVFTAAAEGSSDTVDDGSIEGAAIGVLTPDGEIASFTKTKPMVKLEGVSIVDHGATFVDLVLVTDADDATKPATMYRVRLPL